ncbi:MAG TPA: phosphatase PAP2 family protein [Mycobacteriales bacterium]|nr:phosphatase PAP2 family protein [Mycobacteriales bacterium]
MRRDWSALRALDDAATAGAEQLVSSSPLLLELARGATLLGDPLGMTVAALALAVGLSIAGRYRLAAFVVAVRVGTQLLSSVTKELVDRARPVFDVPVDTASGASFPSGHTLAGTGMWLALAVLLLPVVAPRLRPLVVAACTAVAVAVAASRVLLGVHYLSDVVGGLLLGAGWVALCAAVLVRWRAEEGVRVASVADAVEAPDPVEPPGNVEQGQR